MSDLITLTAPTVPLEAELAVETRPTTEADIEALGDLYFTSYDPGLARNTVAEATAEMREILGGGHGTFLFDASPLVTDENGNLIAAVLVVERANGDDLPDCPFILELFTHAEHRRQGLADQLVHASMATLHQAGYEQIALRIRDDNAAALALYLAMDFRRWDPEIGLDD